MEEMNTRSLVILGMAKTRMAALVKVEELAEELQKHGMSNKHTGIIWR